jgi:hypothetical protein
MMRVSDMDRPSYSPRPLSSDVAMEQEHHASIGRSNQRGRNARMRSGPKIRVPSTMPSVAATDLE